jgi:anhydro-N-acetylmuramic acid kinase
VHALVTEWGHLPARDLVATLTEFAGRTIGDAVSAHRIRVGGEWEIVVAGGGARNATMLRAVERWAEAPLRLSDEFGIPADAKEAIAFAFLAVTCLRGLPGNLPNATGAAGPRVLGQITPA